MHVPAAAAPAAAAAVHAAAAAPAALAREWAVVGGSTAIRLALAELAASQGVKWHPGVCACSF